MIVAYKGNLIESARVGLIDGRLGHLSEIRVTTTDDACFDVAYATPKRAQEIMAQQLELLKLGRHVVFLPEA